MPFRFEKAGLPGLTFIYPDLYPDERGTFWEAFKSSQFKAAGLPGTFLQSNLSRSRQGVLRGLHYQLAPHSQGKLIQVLEGEIYQVAVDLREGSPTFGEWRGNCLSAANPGLIYFPEGMAHGFQVLSETALLAYQVTREYAPDFERGIHWGDPSLGIDWPLPDPLLSDRDKTWPTLAEAEINFLYSDDGG